MPQTVAALLRPMLHAHPSAPAQRFLRDGEWHARDYGELHALVAGVAEGLADAGIGRGDRIGLMVRTRPDWTVIELAAAVLGAVLVPVYPTATPEQLEWLLASAEPRMLIVEAGTPLPPAARGLPAGVVEIGRAEGELGSLLRSSGGLRGTDKWAAGLPDDVFTIAFSSGSTGRPKGCVILQRNYAAVLRMVLEAERHPVHAHAHRASAFIYLPLAHASARLQQLTSLCLGGEIVYGDGSRGTAGILEQIAESAPSYVAGVPRLFEQAAARHAEDPGGLRAAFGERLVYALSGGAPLAHDVLDVYAGAGVAIVDGYGLTESSTAVAIGTPHDFRRGTVGRPLPGLEVRIAADGEVLVRGPNVFAGYLGDPEATARAITDGWLRTGDLGRVDEAGFLTITGRAKNVIVTSTGKNISPEDYENAFRAETGVEDFVLVGDRRPYVIGIAAAGRGRALETEVLRSAALRLNGERAPQERVQKILVLDEPFRQELGESTASGKVVRTAVERRHRDRLDRIYAGDAATPVLHVEDQPGGIVAAGRPITGPATEGV
ncbi:AMP-dependent synthetase/ligase [Leucobacter allii]|uniref:AMP-dependent synthetase/ligase n=1 Tax=Leucobacter allii TaxID=2932247 RepID=A0ABY4FIV4_9MICO|nr:AMP-dependent synthetase/ligase [Leucobacter allii]UOQ56443.1 AMP-dependent synthetase/ligase [Leucobacter allii]UOR00877.1 AMP-dependent synthetase/ligase [Leucobacter allii]